MDINIRIAGEAGQGVQTTGNLLVGALSDMGLHVASTKSYMSRIRGGLNWYDIRIGDEPLYAGRDDADVLVALSDGSWSVLAPEVTDGGVVLYDGEEPPELPEGSRGEFELLAIDLAAAAKEAGAPKIMANTVAAGSVYRFLGYDADPLCNHLGKVFKKKSDEVVEQNTACARKGFELAEEQAGAVDAPEPGGAPTVAYGGADTIGLAAAVAGVKLVSCYPMTPGTGTFNALASLSDRFGIVVEQAEDEIAAVNMLCGATYAGVPSLASTSGGGFALMAEGLSLAGIMELPIAVVVAQRPGPATGLPTRTGQQDLLFALNAGHGEFARAVYAPGTIEQCYELTRRALETAHASQTPALLLTDQYLQDMQRNIEPVSEEPETIDRAIVPGGKDYRRYAPSDDGVSPRAIPGGDAFVVVDSDEHTADGHITENLEAHLEQQNKRMRKLEGMRAGAIPPERYGPDDAETLLLCWGSTYGPVREAVDRLGAGDEPAAMLHFAQLWPLDDETVAEAIGSPDRLVCIEGNQTGQLATLLTQINAIGQCELLLRYDGMPFTAQWIIERL